MLRPMADPTSPQDFEYAGPPRPGRRCPAGPRLAGRSWRPAAVLVALALLGGCSQPPPPTGAGTTAPTTAAQTTAAQTTAAQTTAVQTTAVQTTAAQTTAAQPTAAQPTAASPTTPQPPASPPAPAPAVLPSSPTLQPLRGGPVLAVKIDNTGSSRPRVGLGRADVVYVEPVEGGLTRLLAIFSTSQAGEVGPVRSARESDVPLLSNYGPVAFAFSGASAATLRILGGGHQVNLSNDASGQGYRRDGARPAPYNVIGSPSALLARAGGSVPLADVGFRFGRPSAGGVPANHLATRWPASGIDLSWDPGRQRYLVSTDGKPDIDADGTQHAAATVVVQVVASHLSQNRDVNGAQTPVVDVVGQGAATVLRDGRAWTGEWSRPTPAAPTSFTTNGQPIAMAPGPVWVLLVPQGQATQLG